MRRLTMAAALAAGVLVAAACGDSTTNGSTTELDGIFVADSVSGSITFTISSASLSLVATGGPSASVESPAASVAVTGTLKITGGATVTLTGTYDTGTHAITASGGGYSFTGSFTGGVLSGTFTTPGGGNGSFTTASTASGATVTSYCGTYQGANQGETGVFNLVVNTGAGTVNGFAHSVNQTPGNTIQLTGTVSGSTVTLNSHQLDGEMDTGTATATISGSSISGNYHDATSGDSGTFTGSVCH